MATIYICKCGRRVRKSTNADNTGNRDTENCKGCPYLLPWGPTQWDATRHAMVTDVKGYECRMSPSLDYATYYQGGGEDKCVLHIYSLDYDFLDRVTAWAAKQFPDKEISCSFDRSKIRATEFIGGLYGMSVYPMQNKKGMAAKAVLIERFFGPDGRRLDKTPEEEKAHVLAAIEAGKAMAQERKENMDYIISKHEATGRLYAYYKGSFWFWDSHIQRWLLSQFAEDLYQEERPKRWNFEREHFLAQTSDFHQLDDYEVPSRCIETLLQCNPKTAIPAPASAESPEIVDECSEPNCTCSDCKRQDCTCAGGRDASSRGKCDGEKNCAQDGCSYTAKHRENPTNAAEDAQQCAPTASDAPLSQSQSVNADAQQGDGDDTANPTYSAVATAATSDGSAARMCEGPDEETRTTPAAASGAALESLPAQAAPQSNEPARDIAADAPSAQGFDFGADVATNAELLQCAQTFVMGRVAQVMAAKKAHDITANHYQGSWGKWCQAVGISRDTGDNLVRVAEQFGNTQINGQNLIDIQPLKLLYATSKASTPLEIREKVENLDITTYKQYQDAMSEIKARDAKIQELLEMSEGADRRADAADARAKKAEQERDAARDAQANLSAMANKFSKQRDAAEQRVEDAEHRAEEAERRARAAEEDAAGWKQAGLEMQELVDQRDERIRELESGITVEAAAVDQEEIERRANELSEPLVKIIDQQNEQIERMASGNTVSAQASVLEQYLRTMQTSLLGNARRAELAFYDVGALDSLAQALREFADEIDGLFEEGEENEE